MNAPTSYGILRKDVVDSIDFIDALADAILEAVISRQSEIAMSGAQDSLTFPINLRPTAKGTPKGSCTVHRLPDGCRHAKTHVAGNRWTDVVRWVGVRKMARARSLGCCQRCWSTDAATRTAELQSLLRV